MKSLSRFFPVLLGLALSIQVHGGPYSQWSHSVPLILNTSSTGANVAGTVENFPVLVRLTDANFNFTEAKDDGSDIRFGKTDASGTEAGLPFQIERWSKTGKTAEIWVKVDKILGANRDQFMTMYWGNASPSAPPAAPVFSTSNGFVSVWHLSENPGFASGGYKDAGTQGNHGTAVSLHSPPIAILSQGATVGIGARYEDANDQYITVANESNFDLTNQITLSMWMKVDSWNTSYQVLIAKGDHAWRLARNGTNGSASSSTLQFATDAVSANHLNGTFNFAADTWYNVAAVYDGATKRIYVDGILRDQTAVAAPIATTNAAVHIGNNSEVSWRSWDGFLDEVRVDNTARSADWVKLGFENQKSNQTLITFVSKTDYLPLAGGTMYGTLDMRGQSLTNVASVVSKKWHIVTPDYVFEPGYSLPSIASVEAFTKANRHLPGIPGALEMQSSGLDVAAMNLRLLKQIEDLHLYLIDQDKRLDVLEGSRKK